MNSRPLCHTLSNALEISKNIPLTSTEGLLWKLDCISWIMARILVILELSGRKTDCQGWKSLLNKQVKQGIIDYPFKYFANSSETDAPREVDVDWTWILRWYIEEQISTNFHVIFTYFFRSNFANRKIHVVSTYIFWRNIDSQKIHIVSKYFLWWNFTGKKIHIVFTSFFKHNFAGRKIHIFLHTFFNVTSMIEKSMMFPRTFVDIISLAEKSKLILLTFFNVILIDKNSTTFLVKLQANENLWGCLPLLLTLKSWFLQCCSS